MPKVVPQLPCPFNSRSAALLIILIYLSCCLLLRFGQGRLIFHPSARLKATPAQQGLTYEEVHIPVSTGSLHGWWIPAAVPDAPVILYLHGNGSNVGDLVNQADRLHQLGFSVLLFDYRGYGHSSPPFPNEAIVYEDGEAVWQYLTQTRQVVPQRIVLVGESLGGAVAIELARLHPELAGIIVQSSFTSMRGLAEHTQLSRLFPVDWLLTQRFDSLSKVRSLQVPSLFIHGTADKTIPPHMSQALYAAAPQPKHLLLVPEATHNNVSCLGGAQYLQAIRAFVEQYGEQHGEQHGEQ
jgi:fermentation-respiration switch protein FrsA (DUF1100 family)